MVESGFFNYFTAIISCLSPIIIAILTLMNTRAERRNKDYIETKKKLDEEERRRLERERDDEDREKRVMKEEIENLHEQILSLQRSVDDILTAQKDFTRTCDQRFKDLAAMSTMTFQYCKSLSAVTVNIGAALMTDENITNDAKQEIKEALHKHQQEEGVIESNIYKVRY